MSETAANTRVLGLSKSNSPRTSVPITFPTLSISSVFHVCPIAMGTGKSVSTPNIPSFPPLADCGSSYPDPVTTPRVANLEA